MSPDSFNWEEYVELAGEILKQKSVDESMFRTGISRSYYGIFNICKKFAIDNNLLNKDKLKKSYTSHADLIDKFIHSYRFDIEYSKELNEVKKEVGEILKELRDYRNDADYSDVYPIEEGRDIERDLEFAIESAKEAIEYIKTLQEGIISNQECS